MVRKANKVIKKFRESIKDSQEASADVKETRSFYEEAKGKSRRK